nr:HAD-IIA family hydrolase [Candidatus Sigynarchaeota archaeon]
MNGPVSPDPWNEATRRVLGSKQLWILDLDGVVYNGSDPVPGAAETVVFLQRRSKVVFLTNNSARTRRMYVEMLENFGIHVNEEDIFTSATITASKLAELANVSGDHDKNVYVIGEDGLKEELASAGFKIARDEDFERNEFHCVSHVVVGLDRDVTYRKLFIALNCIIQGAKFIATNEDVSLPLEGGLLGPGAGSIVRAIAACSRKEPELGSPFGKPNPLAFRVIQEATRIDPGSLVSVGDRIETDIVSGKKAGTTTILVLSGIATASDVERLPASLKPDMVLGSVRDIKELLDH